MMHFIERRTISHWLAAIADSCCSVWQSRMRVNRLLTVLVFYLKLIVEENCIFPERRMNRIVNICKKSAFCFFPCNRVKPSGLRLFNDYCTEKSVNISPLFTASCIS